MMKQTRSAWARELVRTRDICPGYLHVPSDFALLNALGALASVDARLELGVDLLGDVGGVLDGHDLSAVVCPLVHDLSLGVMIGCQWADGGSEKWKKC